MLTYNQEGFITQAIEGVLMQETNFKYELVIGEDFSTDRTRAICEEYAAVNPEKIKLLPSYQNRGLIHNFISTYKECDGKYVAICDGDDFWTDPKKLQKQVDFLESNPDFSIVFTSFKFLFPDGRMEVKDYKKVKQISTFNDLIFGNYISSVTAVFRNKKNENDFPAWIGKCPYGDWPLYLWTTRQGSKIKYLDDVTAVYRREIGVSEKMKLVPSKIAKENLKIINEIYKDQNFIHNKGYNKKSIHHHQLCLIAEHFREDNLKTNFKLIIKVFIDSPFKFLRVFLFLIRKEIKTK